MEVKNEDPQAFTQSLEDEKVEETILLEESTKTKKSKLCPLCPPRGKCNEVITSVALLVLLWGVIWSYTGIEVYPGGSLFGMLVIFCCALLGGRLMQFIKIPIIPPLPPLLGMLLAGFLVRNIPVIRDYVKINQVWSSYLRNTALTIILVRAGLGLDPQALEKLKGVCLRLSMGPCCLEACSAAVFSHFIMKFPWRWGFLLGFVLGAVSPAVVVPAMLMLQEQGYGVKKGIPTLLIAASSFDDILAITGFNSFLSLTFTTGPVYKNIIKAVLEIVIGITAGIVMGYFIRYFPSTDQPTLAWKRAFLLLGLSIMAVIGSGRIGIHGAGGLAAIVLTFVSAIGWKDEKKARVQQIVANSWLVFQPLLFGLVGAEVSVENLESNTIGICVGTLSLSLLVRIFATFLLVSFAGFSYKERIFVALSWLPKATVQAVLGPLALEETRTKNFPQLEVYAKNVMTMAFLAILITAPNGALLIGLVGPKVLSLDKPNEAGETVSH
ncbi:sodium/hydrogen exchanger 9B1-like [Trichosurus vulpecula]|uniref:sodium/hydrogen exchanger 9B1-like n=1 Tax=Trichosurus vulpecula TaxID=9337 RepID=UPI00186AE729|nr:sodium/hydrogen exchanger 9B1-like [Trichosurus vulpecula]